MLTEQELSLANQLLATVDLLPANNKYLIKAIIEHHWSHFLPHITNFKTLVNAYGCLATPFYLMTRLMDFENK